MMGSMSDAGNHLGEANKNCGNGVLHCVFALPKIRRDEPAFLLYTDAARYYILPKAEMQLEQQDGLREILRTKLQEV